MHDGLIKIRIAAAAIENATNLALIDFLAHRLGIAKRFVRIVSGSASRKKVMEIVGLTAAAIGAALGK
jgi:uncharacterized protein YggU (UPF0235/DUF167 family)